MGLMNTFVTFSFALVRLDKTRLRRPVYRDSLNLAYPRMTDCFLPHGTTQVTWQKKMWLLARPT